MQTYLIHTVLPLGRHPGKAKPEVDRNLGELISENPSEKKPRREGGGSEMPNNSKSESSPSGLGLGLGNDDFDCGRSSGIESGLANAGPPGSLVL